MAIAFHDEGLQYDGLKGCVVRSDQTVLVLHLVQTPRQSPVSDLQVPGIMEEIHNQASVRPLTSGSV